MPKINYSNLTIYKLYCKDETVSDIFVRSTSNLNVKRAIHKRNLITKPDDEISLVINANGGWENWNTDILEIYNCNSSKEASDRENYWYNSLKSTEITQNPTEITQNPTEITQNPTEIEEIKPECKGCCKVFSRNDSLKRHIVTCKEIKKQQKEKDEKIKKLENECINILLTNIMNKYAHKSETEQKFITQIATDVFSEILNVTFDKIH